MSKTPTLAALAKAAIDKAGGGAQLGRILGIPKTTIQSWKTSRIPADRVKRISQLTGIPPEKIRPDVFGARNSAGHLVHSSVEPAELVGPSNMVVG